MPSETARYPQSYMKHITSNSCRTAGQSASYFSQDMDISSNVQCDSWIIECNLLRWNLIKIIQI